MSALTEKLSRLSKKEQQVLKQRLMDAFGSDSEPEEKNEQWSDTSVSECENDHDEDMVELTFSDIEEDISNLQVGKIHAEQIAYDERKHAKELAQFQRQMAAPINNRKYDEEIGQYGIEVFQQAEDILWSSDQESDSGHGRLHTDGTN